VKKTLNAEKKTLSRGEGLENVVALAAFGIIILLIVGLFTNWYGLAQGKSPDDEQRTFIPVEADPVRGNLSSAKVSIIIFSDFECPFCKLAEDTVKALFLKYDGKVALVFKHYPLTQIHPNSMGAALASECANEQGRFWEYHDYLFEHNNALESIELKAYAKELGLDTARFNECLDSQRHSFSIQRDVLVGRQVGVSSTPTFYINGIQLVGAQPGKEFSRIIESEMKR
jgi:protein-disulfide isomerase